MSGVNQSYYMFDASQYQDHNIMLSLIRKETEEQQDYVDMKNKSDVTDSAANSKTNLVPPKDYNIQAEEIPETDI